MMLNKAIKIENGNKLELFRSIIERFTTIEPLFGYVQDEYVGVAADSGYMVYDEESNSYFLTKTIINEEIIDLDEFSYLCATQYIEDITKDPDFDLSDWDDEGDSETRL